ncbi:helix-turn-helix transcriptional regulator [Paenibacillus mesophilus]|uniref:helix-turn-helix transcriptional regulator n=1 Tax=Paenibacillus mesophilus TaxID=2582849 RepID=UPI001EE3BD30|nr:WYL domain-containing transcriptional regulator [Paenibacillus mesophilus]
MLHLFEKLSSGECIRKKELAEELQVSEKAVQRDIEDLREFFQLLYKDDEYNAIRYDEKKRGYLLSKQHEKYLSNEEILVLAKVILESRAFPSEEMKKVLDKLVGFGAADQRKHITEMLRNERFHYRPVSHGQPLFRIMWDLSYAVKERRIAEITYLRVGDEAAIQRQVEPLGIMFSEYYFYLIAFIHGADKQYPAIYRLDRIQNYQVTDRHFYIPDHNRFQEGEFRKQVQFMQTGHLMDVKFRFWGASLEAVLDRLPNATVTKNNDGAAIVEAKVFGRGITMWLLSQAQFVEVLKPDHLREEMKRTLEEMVGIYRAQ